MIYIEKMSVSKPFMYIWLKKVEGVDLEHHCAKCLVGSYNPSVNKDTKELSELPLDNGIWYLCGVSNPYNWYKHFHLAFEHKEGSTIEYSVNGISVTIRNAVQLPISTEYIDMGHVYANRTYYYTCRNWQFAHYLNSYKF